MKVEEYTKAITECVVGLRTTQDEYTIGRATQEIAEIETEYREIIPVEHQPLTDKQHRNNCMAYNPSIQRALNCSRSAYAISGILLSTVLMLVLGSDYLGGDAIVYVAACLIMIAFFISIAGIAGYVVAYCLTKKWLAEHPIDQRVVWFVADYSNWHNWNY